MSVLIKGVKMPKSCAECIFSSSRNSSLGEILKCKVNKSDVGAAFNDPHDVLNKRHSDCPLVEVPEKHGDLIDTDRLLGVLGMSLLNAETCNAQEVHTVLMTLVMPLIASQPIIIEAEDKK